MRGMTGKTFHDEVPPIVRPTVRVLLLDDADRLLLFRSENRLTGESFWFAAGGAIEPGESAQEAAVRELEEETGLSGAELGPEVWRRRHVLDWDGVVTDIRERFFLARVPAFEIDTTGWTEAERISVLEHRWWGVSAMRALDARRAAGRARDRLVPMDLADRLTHLLLQGPPERPIEVGL